MNKLEPVIFFIGLFLFIAFFYSYWKTLCIDWARQLMFEERANLVRLALAGELSFDSPVYRTARQLIEKNIRFLHALTWPRLVMWEILRANIRHSGIENKIKRTREIINSEKNPHVKKELHEILNRVGFASAVCLMGRSLILGPVFLCLYFLRLLRDTTDSGPSQNIYSTVNKSALCYDDAHLNYAKHDNRIFAEMGTN